MNLLFDHLVHFVQNPVQAAEEMKYIGVQAFMGGNHEKWGTYNSLAYFGLSYIEFLGIREREIAEEAALHHDLTRQAITLLPHYQGFNRIALRTNNIEKVAKHAQTLGYIIEGPVNGERTRDDGVTIRWKMLFIKDELSKLPFPFIIQWQQSDEERFQDLHEKINAHPLGKVEIEDLVIAVDNVENETEKWSKLFGLKRSEPYLDEELQAECIQLFLQGGNLTFASLDKSWKFYDDVNEHGEGPFLLRLIGDRSIPLHKLLGAYFHVKGRGK
ncbi:VOC family protein [Bacillus sp. FJAT-49736]|uniref:VOC family protein n=1 Tax=Bacillus sp. FJAT-49736 TaxID=2833582 RepID=UPI001BC90F83|nr:VOC family protein [Bacillus sp. FJAT-49736]MBS4174929.1 VOC family protein [Bacillus sp. FJAT-49736]